MWFKKKINFEKEETRTNELYKTFKNANTKEDLMLVTKEFCLFHQSYHGKLTNYIKSESNQILVKKARWNLIRINAIYNEMYNYSYLMLDNKFYESYEKQKQFLSNPIFNNLLLQETEIATANQVIYSATIKVILSILCYKHKQDIKNQTIEHDYIQYYDKIKEVVKSVDNNKNKRFFKLITAFNLFIDGNINESIKELHQLFMMDYIKFQEQPHMIPLQYIGMGYNAFMTIALPNEFKSFINETMMNYNQHNIEMPEKTLMSNKQTSNTLSPLEEQTIKLFSKTE